MLDDWWDTEEYRKRFVPYYQKQAELLLEWYLTRPKHRVNILQSWYDLGEQLEREYRFRMENGYDTKDIEKDIAFYQECSKILQEWIQNGTERSVSDAQ
jgi:DNA-binding SARP family transcriptional activator